MTMTNEFPDWAGFTPEFAAAELPRLLAEAENRMHTIKALFVSALCDRKSI